MRHSPELTRPRLDSAASILLLALAGWMPIAAAADAPADARSAVLAVVTALFDGMRARDADAMRAVFADEARLGSDSVDGFIAAVSGGERYLDEVTFDETVLVDGDLAMAWTPYNLFVDGDFHHCGVDLFVMRRRDGQWRITQLDDTRRTVGCDSSRP